MANYILSDGPDIGAFIAGLEETSRMKWHLLWREGHANVAKWRRIVNYFLFPLRFLLGHRHIEHVVAWQQFYGITTAFYHRLLPLHRDMRITVMTFIYKPKAGVAGMVYHHFVETSLDSSNVTDVIVFSKSEVKHYAKLFPKAAHKFRYMPLGIAATPDIEPHHGDYIFTAGISNRDYDFLIRALAGTDYRVRIACPGVKVPDGVTNTEVLDDCYGDRMLRELAGCRAVVIPLKDRNISSGQLMLLQAMQMGKPVIVTRTDALAEYVEDGCTAIFIDNEPTQLRDALHRLHADPSLYEDIAENAKRKVTEEFSERKLGERVGAILL